MLLYRCDFRVGKNASPFRLELTQKRYSPTKDETHGDCCWLQAFNTHGITLEGKFPRKSEGNPPFLREVAQGEFGQHRNIMKRGKENA